MTDQPIDMDITSVEYKGRLFYKSDFLGETVIKTNDNYYNATKIAQGCLYQDFAQVSRLKNWIEYVETVKEYGRYNITTGNIDFDPVKLDPKHKLENSMLCAEPCLDKQNNIIYRNVTDIDLMFKIPNNSTEYKWMNGTYIHKCLIHQLLSFIDPIYAFKINTLIDMIDEEIHLRNITLEDKLQEVKDNLESLKDLHEKSGRSENHDKPGCIIIRATGKPNEYRVSFDTKERTIPERNAIHFNYVFNPSSTCSKLKFYARKNIWENVKYVANGKFNNSTMWIKDMQSFKDAIKDVQKFNIEQPSFDVIIANAKEGHKSRDCRLKAEMFEIYCSIQSGIKLFKYETGERLSLRKNDNGLDLLDIDHEIMGQCKYYIARTPVCIAKTKQFLQFCKDYPDYKHKLFVSSLSCISKEIQNNTDIEIISINDDEFTDWFIKNTDDLDVYESIKRYGDFTKEQFENAQEWLIHELNENDYILRNYAIEEINKLFDLKINGNIHFGQLFSHLYRLKYNSFMPKDEDGNEILVSLEKPLPEFESPILKKQKQEIIKLIGNGQYTHKDIDDELKKILGCKPTPTLMTHRFKELFVEGKGRIQIKDINNKKQNVYELKDRYYSNKYDEFRDFITENSQNHKNKTGLRDAFNIHFHRYESSQTFHHLIQLLKINLDY